MVRFIVFLILALAACTTNAEELRYKKFITSNAENISKLTSGMTKAEVMNVMKDHTTKVPNGRLNNPYKAELFQRDSDTYEVLYFLTRIHPPFTPILDNQATPVVLKNGIVAGWGRSALQLAKPK
jgi:hypothetical protein